MTNQTETTTNKRSFLTFLTGGKIYLINAHFQYRFMASIILLMIFSMAIIYGANFYFFETFITKGQSLNLPENHTFFILIRQQQEFMTKVFFGVAIILSTVTGVWGLFYSHRIAGPLYRLNLYFRNAAQDKDSKLRPVNFRENDFFQEVPEAINNYFDSLKVEENSTSETPPSVDQAS